MLHLKFWRFCQRVISRLRSLFLVRWYGFKGRRISIGKNVDIPFPEYVTVGDDSVIDNDCEIFVMPTFPGVVPKVSIGSGVRINKCSIIGCANAVILEDNVRIAPHVHISDRNHSFSDVNTPINLQPVVSKGPVRIGKRSWLGFGVQVMSGVSIGEHCVIAAGSIVTRSIPDFSVAAGNPARVIKRYNFDTSKWESVS